MAASSAPKVKKALLELLEKELAGQATVHVTYAHPGAAIQQEAVYFGRTTSHETAKALGARRRDEEYELELVLDVAQDGDNAQVAEERAWEILAIIENAIRANPGKAGDALAGTVDGWVAYLSTEMTPHILEGQRLAEAVCRIEVYNRK